MGACCESEAVSLQQQVEPDTMPMKRTNDKQPEISVTESLASETASSTTQHSEQEKMDRVVVPTINTLSAGAAPSPMAPTPVYDLNELHRELQTAINDGNETMLSFLLADHPKRDLVNAVYQDQTPLQFAMSKRKHAIMKFLLKHGANPDVKNARGDSLLHVAARVGDVRSVEILLEFNVDKTVQNEEEETALDVALEEDTKQHRDIQFLLEPDKQKLLQLKEVHSYRVVEHLSSAKASDWADNVLSGNNGTPSTNLTEDNVSELFKDIEADIDRNSKKLQPMEGWLDRKQTSPPYSWLKRWVVVKDRYLMWSDMQRTIEVKTIDAKEKKRWNKCISLVDVTEVEEVKDTKHKRKFNVKVGRKVFHFRAKDEAERDRWMKNLRQNMQYAHSTTLIMSQ